MGVCDGGEGERGDGQPGRQPLLGSRLRKLSAVCVCLHQSSVLIVGLDNPLNLYGGPLLGLVGFEVVAWSQTPILNQDYLRGRVTPLRQSPGITNSPQQALT